MADVCLNAGRFHGGDKPIEGFAFMERIVDQFSQLVPERGRLFATQPVAVIPALEPTAARPVTDGEAYLSIYAGRQKNRRVLSCG